MSKQESIDISLIEIHRLINEYTNQFISEIGNNELNLVYPPGTEFNEVEQSIFQNIKLTEKEKNVLSKATKDLLANVFHGYFSLLDGVSDPVLSKNKLEWNGLSLEEKDENKHYEFLHDEFFSKYWDYNEDTT